MRLLVMFDLPTGSKKDRKSYAQFRKFLLDDGYQMEQFSVYSSLSFSRENIQSHIARLRANLPEAGIVTVYQFTEKQYEGRELLVNTYSNNARTDTGAQLTLSF